MAMSYDQLVGDKSTDGSIKSWMNYSKMDVESILSEAQAMIYTRLRVREMRTSDTLTLKIGKSEIDVPDDWLDPFVVKDITNDCDLDYCEVDDLEARRTYTDGVLDSNDPTAYAVDGESLIFDGVAENEIKILVRYFGQPADLSSSNPTNFLTRRYPQLLRMACLATAARFNSDDATFNREQALLFKEIDEVAASDEMGRSTDVGVTT